MGINQANGFKTHNELTMYPLGNYPLAPSVGDVEVVAVLLREYRWLGLVLSFEDVGEKVVLELYDEVLGEH